MDTDLVEQGVQNKQASLNIDLLPDNTSTGDDLREPIRREIVIPDGLEVIGGQNAGQAGVVYLDRRNGRAYRTVDLTRYPGENEFVRRDFARKVEVSRRDVIGLTAKVFAYDPDTLVLEIELLDGRDLTHNVDIALATAQRFFDRLAEFHRLGLYHGDLFTFKHYFLTESGELRLIDPIYIDVDSPEARTTLENIQATDTDLALRRLHSIGVDTSSLVLHES